MIFHKQIITLFGISVLCLSCTNSSSIKRSPSSMGGREVTNGGNVVKCVEPDGKVTYNVLDFMARADNIKFYESPEYKKTINKIVTKLMSNKKYGLLGLELKAFSDSFDEDSVSSYTDISEIMKHKKTKATDIIYWRVTEEELTAVGDENLEIKISSNCNLIQAIRRNSNNLQANGLIFTLNKHALLNIPLNQLSWLVIHEFLWSKLSDSKKIRLMNEYLHSQNFLDHDLSKDEMIEGSKIFLYPELTNIEHEESGTILSDANTNTKVYFPNINADKHTTFGNEIIFFRKNHSLYVWHIKSKTFLGGDVNHPITGYSSIIQNDIFAKQKEEIVFVSNNRLFKFSKNNQNNGEIEEIPNDVYQSQGTELFADILFTKLASNKYTILGKPTGNLFTKDGYYHPNIENIESSFDSIYKFSLQFMNNNKVNVEQFIIFENNLYYQVQMPEYLNSDIKWRLFPNKTHPTGIFQLKDKYYVCHNSLKNKNSNIIKVCGYLSNSEYRAIDIAGPTRLIEVTFSTSREKNEPTNGWLYIENEKQCSLINKSNKDISPTISNCFFNKYQEYMCTLKKTLTMNNDFHFEIFNFSKCEFMKVENHSIYEIKKKALTEELIYW